MTHYASWRGTSRDRLESDEAWRILEIRQAFSLFQQGAENKLQNAVMLVIIDFIRCVDA